MITPAISVLSAVEGLEVATPFFKPYIVPITIVVLVLLFMFQRRGTAGVGMIFGPVTLLWFATLAVLGIRGILWHPSVVLLALNPMHAVTFFMHNGLPGFFVLGAVFLVATGGEALYADLGHFGETPDPDRLVPDRRARAGAPLPRTGRAAASSIRRPRRNPFYLLAPKWALYPLVVLATLRDRSSPRRP